MKVKEGLVIERNHQKKVTGIEHSRHTKKWFNIAKDYQESTKDNISSYKEKTNS